MKWLVNITQTYALNNALEKAAYPELKLQNRLVLDNLQPFKNFLIGMINAVNERYPKCRPIEIKFSASIHGDFPDESVYFSPVGTTDTCRLLIFQLIAIPDDYLLGKGEAP